MKIDKPVKGIYCIGSINWDMYDLEKASFEKVEPFETLGGSACNTAYYVRLLESLYVKSMAGAGGAEINLSRENIKGDFMLNVGLIGLVGDDAVGRKIIQILKEKGIYSDYIGIVKGETGRARIIIDDRGEREIIRLNSLSSLLSEHLKKNSVVEILSSPVNEFHLKTSRKAVLSFLGSNKKIYSIDISGLLKKDEDIPLNKLFGMVGQIEIITANREEFREFFAEMNIGELIADVGDILDDLIEMARNANNGDALVIEGDPPTDVRYVSRLSDPGKSPNHGDLYGELFSNSDRLMKIGKMLWNIAKLCNVHLMAIKRGERGATLIEFLQDGSSLKILLYDRKAPEVKVVDTTGAGDAFNAGLLWCLLRKIPVNVALDVAVRLGSLNCTVLGGQSLKEDDLTLVFDVLLH